MARHPSDAERADRVAPVREAVARALAGGDGDGLAGLLRDDAAWVSPDGVHEGDDARARAVALAVPGARWAEPQVTGARAVFRAESGAALVVELRGEHVVWAAQA